MQFTVQEQLSGMRLDLFLKEALSVSRSQAKKLIDAGGVTINEKPAIPHTPVVAGDIVEVKDPEASKGDQRHPKGTKGIDTRQPIPELSVLYEDNDVLVINKSVGVLVHPAPGGNAPTLTDVLRKRYPEIAGVGDNPERPGIVHRLDKDVSGVMIVAKTQQAYTYLKEKFQSRDMEKTYLALVHGNLPRPLDTIRFKIARSKDKARMVGRPESQEGKDAVTHYEVLERFKNFDYVNVRIETGRTHQIRAHFHALGHPVAGDPLYTIKGVKPLPIDRIFLHSHRLTLQLPNGEQRTFEVPLPKELGEELAKLPKK